MPGCIMDYGDDPTIDNGGIDRIPVVKDTIPVPGGQYARIRVSTCNPGYWFLHCHVEWHMHVGMRLIMKVGERSEMVPPPAGFPQCGNYMPTMNKKN